MPLSAEYTWTERKDRLTIKVPLRNVSPQKVDILVTSNTLKVNFSPYIIDIVLIKEIDAVKHKATVKEGVLVITLLKADSCQGIWGALVPTNVSKDELTAMKTTAEAQNRELQTELATARKDRRIEDERVALRKQMKLEETEKTLIETLKAEEKEAAEDVMYKKFAEMEQEERRNVGGKSITSQKMFTKASAQKEMEKETVFSGLKTTTSEASPGDKDIFGESDLTSTEGGSTVDLYMDKDDIDEEDIDSDSESDEDITPSTAAAKTEPVIEQEDDDELAYVPPPRSAGYSSETRVEITYTPRIFPTPMRESKQAEEEDWIAKNRQNLKKHALFNKNLLRNPDGRYVYLPLSMLFFVSS